MARIWLLKPPALGVETITNQHQRCRPRRYLGLRSSSCCSGVLTYSSLQIVNMPRFNGYEGGIQLSSTTHEHTSSMNAWARDMLQKQIEGKWDARHNTDGQLKTHLTQIPIYILTPTCMYVDLILTSSTSGKLSRSMKHEIRTMSYLVPCLLLTLPEVS